MSYETDNHAMFVSLVGNDEVENKKALESFFVGELATWASNRMHKFGDLVIPKHVYVEWIDDNEPHRVAWVEHIGESPQTEEPYHVHHVVCDCATELNFNDGKGGIDTSLCSALEDSILARAQFVDYKYNVRRTINAYQEEIPEEMYKKSIEFHDIVMNAIEGILVLDMRQPEEWLGNVISGQHKVEPVAEIIHEPAEVVTLYANLLELDGKIDFDGETLKLAA